MRVGTFCSGILAPEVAWRPLGWEPVFFSEIDPFACALESHHFPGVPNLGDMVRVWALIHYGGKRIKHAKATAGLMRQRYDLLQTLRSANLWCAGTPCQSFSVAGHRKSLDDHRGNLSLTFVELVHAVEPEYVVWENVPGVLSTKDNAFGCFLAGLVGEEQPLVCGEGSWPDAGMVAGPVRTAAWRILDAQYFGLAQRRRRVFVVSCRTGDGTNPAAILLEPDRLPWDLAPRRETGARVAASLTRGADGGGSYAGRRREDDVNIVSGPAGAFGDLAGCLDRSTPGTRQRCDVTDNWVVGALSDGAHMGGGATGRTHTPDELSRCLNAGGMGRQDFETETLIPVTGGFFDDATHTLKGEGFDGGEDGTGRGTPLVPVSVDTYNQTLHQTLHQTLQRGTGTDQIGGVMLVPIAIQGNLVGRDSGGPVGKGYSDVGVMFTLTKEDRHAVAFDTTQITSAKNYSNPQPGDPCHPLAAGAHSPAVAFQESQSGCREYDDAGTLRAGGPGHDPVGTRIREGMGVRRLMPVECERLQGFPDCWTFIPYRGKPASDGPRYRGIGNSMATTVLLWIGKRIEMVRDALKARSA